jgi:hypothetical protein
MLVSTVCGTVLTMLKIFCPETSMRSMFLCTDSTHVNIMYVAFLPQTTTVLKILSVSLLPS